MVEIQVSENSICEETVRSPSAEDPDPRRVGVVGMQFTPESLGTPQSLSLLLGNKFPLAHATLRVESISSLLSYQTPYSNTEKSVLPQFNKHY